MMAAAAAGSTGCSVILIEKNEKLGKKMYITGKGRCNITNACPTEDFFTNIVHNSKFCLSSIYTFPSDSLLEKLHENGLQTKVERGMRVFPASDKSSDVIKVFSKMLADIKVKVVLNTTVKGIIKGDGGFTVQVAGPGDSVYEAGSVVIATGGASYPQTGSTGDGYRFAGKFGHSVTGPYPALAPLIEKGRICASLQGLALKNVKFTLSQNGKEIFSDLGEMLFTHEGISGPLVLSASSYLNYEKPLSLAAAVDLKPALSPEKLDSRILRDFEEYKNKQIRNAMTSLLPQRLIEPILKAAGIDGEKPVNSITRQEREELVFVLKAFQIDIKGVAPLEEAIVTRGGVAVREIDPSTLQSKKIPGLFFAGEIMDVDALTGGFNMQIAFSTGYLAGLSACSLS